MAITARTPNPSSASTTRAFSGSLPKPAIPDEVWKRIEPLLPAPKPRRFRNPGRKPIDNRKTLTGIFFVLGAGIPWEDLPQELGCGCGMTCWRRFQEWQTDSVWQRLRDTLVADLHDSAKAELLHSIGQGLTRPRHLPGGSGQTPSFIHNNVISAQRVNGLVPLFDAMIPPVRGMRGRPRRRPRRIKSHLSYEMTA